MAGNTIESGRTVASKLTAILQTFAEGAEHSMTEIARLTGLPMSTAHRLMSELTSRQFLERKSGGQFRVGLALRMIGGIDAGPARITERGPCVLEDLAACMKGRARMGVLEDLDVSYIEKGSEPATSPSAGGSVPAHSSAMGLALLAFSPDETVARIIASGAHRGSRHTVDAPDRLRHTLEVIRLTRVAVTRPEFGSGAHSVAMPVFGPGGRVVAAFELALPNSQDRDVASAVAVLTIACRSLSRELSSATLNSYSMAYAGGGEAERTA